jgi:hypothetical protein
VADRVRLCGEATCEVGDGDVLTRLIAGQENSLEAEINVLLSYKPDLSFA